MKFVNIVFLWKDADGGFVGFVSFRPSIDLECFRRASTKNFERTSIAVLSLRVG